MAILTRIHAPPRNRAPFRASLCRVHEGERYSKKGQSHLQYEETIDRVRQRSGMSCSDDAKTAASAALTVLAEYLNGRERLAEILRRQPPNRGIIFSPNNLGCEETLDSAGAVMDVLGEAIGGCEMEGLRRQFPGGFDPLFGPRTGRRGPEPPIERS